MFSCYVRFRSNVLLVKISIQYASVNMILLYSRYLKIILFNVFTVTRKIYWKITCLTLLIVQEIHIRTTRPSSIFGPAFGQADLRISSLSPILSLHLSFLHYYYRYRLYPLSYPDYPHHQLCSSVANVELTLKSYI